MTTVASAPAPKKSKKNILIFIVLILTLIGIDNSYTHYYFGNEDVNSDSTIVLAPVIDTISNAVTDTIKKDTVK